MTQPESTNAPVAPQRIVLRYFNCRGRGQAVRGHTQHLDIQERALLDAVASAAYLDLTCVIRELLRPRIMPRDEQWSGFFAELMATVSGRLPAFERLLAVRGAPFFGGAAPVAADYFVFEAMDAWLELFGHPLAATLASCAHLSAHRTALLARPKLRAYVGSGQRPAALTASPHERSIRERLRGEWQ